MKYRRDIDGLRAVAVLPVVLDHAHVPGFSGGYIGVDIFFVISGFLITRILMDDIAGGQFSLLRFYERRARRILPALFTVIAATLVAGWWMLVPGQYEALGESVIATTFFFSNYHFLWIASDYFAPGAEFMPLLHTWSLAVEEQFYIVFPLLLLGLTRFASRLVWAGIALMSALSLAYAIWLVGADPVAGFYATPTRAWELGAGALVALSGARWRLPDWLADGLSVLALGAILLPIALYSEATPFPGLAALPPVLGAALLIWTGGFRTTPAARLLSLAPFVGVGLISYSLYLWHWPVLVAARLWVGDGLLPATLVVGAIALSLALATLSWRFVERPFRRPAQAGGLGRRSIFGGAVLGAVLFYTAGSTIDTEDGYAARMPAAIAPILATADEETLPVARCGGRAEGKLCPLGVETAAPEVMIFGDSHAGALAYGFDALLRETGQGGALLYASACTPLAGVRRTDEEAECAAAKARLQEALEGEAFGTIVLVARWALAVEGVRAPGEAPGVALFEREAPGIAPGADGAGLVRAGVAALIDIITASGRRVVLLEGVPEIGYDVPQVYASAALFGADLRPPPGRIATEARNARASAMLAELAAGRPDVVFVPFIAEWCGATCPVADAGGLYYRDDDHLSRRGAEALIADYLRAPLAAALRP
ncbi:Peptidoglycan/LPS O-acetylase OafA/YrhL, contains acyltransferase and SGNH-hydrolase domains [Roseivivax lentus]|uniref:Peptidoglycan/LPS O-acetylase OafA/YrhL, contains acyltransferase and SGNH-hydrolase domains n=1 Tax=Roseivivax lentus TaxID=633194 RepID=A0A1N7PFG4_9RHOB|nr:acyltransferase family protein [Roseivivax lentus]SIT09331.1 Peptidoglycan/LPS O-acetylase OafA/YrhL, contains acyltransferase and SGNH-hydrolase domains [Roseivivax lentus]